MADWLTILRNKQQRVQELREELERLESELREARAILAGEGFELLPPKPKSRHGFTGGKRAKPIQEGSSVWWSQRVLQELGQPTNIDVLLTEIEKRSGEKFKKPTVISNLSRYIAHKDTFTRPATSVYGLIEWEEKNVS